MLLLPCAQRHSGFFFFFPSYPPYAHQPCFWWNSVELQQQIFHKDLVLWWKKSYGILSSKTTKLYGLDHRSQLDICPDDLDYNSYHSPVNTNQQLEYPIRKGWSRLLTASTERRFQKQILKLILLKNVLAKIADCNHITVGMVRGLELWGLVVSTTCSAPLQLQMIAEWVVTKQGLCVKALLKHIWCLLNNHIFTNRPLTKSKIF